MQVANALNNSIRILFNPKLEAFKLFDFLIVKSNDDKYLAQIIEIYDDKFDSSQNVAKLKLFYKITKNNEVMPYDNFTPNKECEIIKVKQEEVEDFINQDKKTFILGTNVKSSCSLNVQYDFFNNGPIILADKIENFCTISLNLAKNLSTERHAVIIDSTGILEYEGAKKIKASQNFRIPLNYTTIDYIFDRCLKDASLEFQTIGGAIINEIKKYAKNQENKFIPFNAFAKVLMDQYKATPYPELKLLLVRLKRFQMSDIFARSKKDKEALFDTIKKNPVTILDLSGVDTSWQKAYLEYITDEIEDDIYLIARINDDNFDVDLINKIYNKKPNIKFVPNTSYNYKKLPTLIQYTKNYVLLPSLYQRTDFMDANFALSNLISDGCILFGENTDNFLYLLKDYELEVQEKRKNYRKIALSLMSDDEKTSTNLGEKGDYFEQKISDSQRLIDELSDFEEEQKTKQEEKESSIEAETEDTSSDSDEFQPLEEGREHSSQDDIEVKEPTDEFQELDLHESPIKEESPETQPPQEETTVDEEDTTVEIIDDAQDNQTDTEEKQSDIINLDNAQDELQFVEDESTFGDNIDFSDEELDFYELKDEDYEAEKQAKEQAAAEEDNDDSEIDLKQVADESLNDSFNSIINKKVQEHAQTINLEDNVTVDESTVSAPRPKENLPIFKEETEKTEKPQTYSIGNVIIHKKYGRGTIVKTIKYEERQLLQIEFEESGRKLLDPKVADIKLEQ